jgi:hypothetical protein
MIRTKIANILLVTGLVVLLAGAAWFGYQVHRSAERQQDIKQDYSFINNITFGLFSVDEWRDRLSEIVNGEVNGFSITPEQKKEMLLSVEKELHGLVAKTVAGIDKPQKSFSGKLKRMAFHAFADSADLQAQVKPFAKTIVQKITSPRSQARLKGIVSGRINRLENQTYDATSEASEQVTKYVYQKYHVSDPDSFNKIIHNRLDAIWQQTIKDAACMLGCVVAALLLWWLMRKRVQLQAILFILTLLFAGVLLVVGLTSPVIEVDARIKSVDLLMLGQKLSFQNQVLFFQSKSIWEIITTLLTQQKPEAVTVGILILLFIVFLPFIRLTAKGLHMFAKNSSVINYLAFEAGKWDMADVMIVGMLMTYIGLNGILQSQLANLNIHNDALTTSTVNYTSLQPGYFIFLGYVIFEMLLSYVLNRISPGYVIRRKRKSQRTLTDESS